MRKSWRADHGALHTESPFHVNSGLLASIEIIETIRQELRADGITASISKLCRWFEGSRRTVSCRSVKAQPKVQARFAEPIKLQKPSMPLRWSRSTGLLLLARRDMVAAQP
ncbi:MULTISPECIES: hypothetical protein [Ralstonia solanacearum species complex]|uniref:hypothetical protein n=1 Tax=Ralstonia solanacearum species complex TaxID=3116862 RepID=UPI001F08A0F8|nr:hypothetical protein [Ralstonia solanacearum]BEU74035.1 hypothetical protein MAFF211271_35900 [Ralstonia pseudosolanacearum]